jgi:leucyl aminopeptidase
LKKNFPLIHAVGRACDDAPRLVELTWGNKSNKALTLIGKGVCFDTGGLDLKSASGMLGMKKDMGGAANAVGLASLIMSAKLPIYLRVLIPIVENSVAGNSMRPGDVFTSRSGKTVEIGNTDAEGRLILADALALAAEAKPTLIIDFATLTGAARVAVGTEIAAMFSDQAALLAKIQEKAAICRDPVWPLPLHKPYRHWIDSDIADLSNNSHHGYAGAITAALFLREFVPDEIDWIHIDMMAANIENLPGRPKGGEAQSIRALFAYLKENY